MNVGELLDKLRDIQDLHGPEIPVMMVDVENGEYEVYQVAGAEFEVSKGTYPDDWEMPKGLKFVLLKNG